MNESTKSSLRKLGSRGRQHFKKRLNAYALTVGGTAASLSCPAVADAAILHSDPADVMATSSPFSVIYFDLDDSAGGTLASNSDFVGSDFQIFFNYDGPIISDTNFYGEALFLPLYGFFPNTDAPKLGYGDPIGPLSTFDDTVWIDFNFAASVNGGVGTWDGGGEGYIGLRISDGGGNFNYGWAHITYEDNTKVTLHDFAIETTENVASAAATIPEPNSLVLAAMGAAGVAALRRRRKNQESSTSATSA